MPTSNVFNRSKAARKMLKQKFDFRYLKKHNFSVLRYRKLSAVPA